MERKIIKSRNYLHYYILPFSSDPLGEEREIIFKDSGQIGTRTEFPESWLWVDYKLPLCPNNDPKWWVNWINYIKISLTRTLILIVHVLWFVIYNLLLKHLRLSM